MSLEVCPIIYYVSIDDIQVIDWDSSSKSSAGSSRKRCRCPAATVTSSIHASRALVPSRADLLPPRKRFRDSISPDDSVKEDIDTDVLPDIEADATAIEVTVDMDVEAEVNAGIGMEVDVRINVEDEVEDEVESSDSSSMPVTRECTYHDFVKCQPLNFKGTEGVFGLTRWFEKMEIVFYISNCPERYQVKYATCTLLNIALTWWNLQKGQLELMLHFLCHGESL
nr:putative retrotransposon Gag domain-containing protein [Tanacetum cinerariifolium]